jgi:hypothetical protein
VTRQEHYDAGERSLKEAGPDEERMRRVLSHIENNLELWDQDHWASSTPCGTAYCFAGWTVVLEGIQIVGPDPDSDTPTAVRFDDLSEPWRSRVEASSRFSYRAHNGNILTVSDLAALILGLSGPGRNLGEHWKLFGACLTLDEIRETIDRICTEASGATPV